MSEKRKPVLKKPNRRRNPLKSRAGAGFYAKVLSEVDKLDFEAAGGIEGIDEEISLLRLKLKQILKDEPQNVKLIMAATDMLAKLIKIRYSMSKKEGKNLGEAIKNILKDIGVPLGVTVLGKKL
jgi:hypothetical protein